MIKNSVLSCVFLMGIIHFELIYAVPQPALAVCLCNTAQDKAIINIHGKLLWMPSGKRISINQYQVYSQWCVTYVTSGIGHSVSLLNLTLGDKRLANRTYTDSITVSFIGQKSNHSILITRGLGPRCLSVAFPVMPQHPNK